MGAGLSINNESEVDHESTKIFCTEISNVDRALFRHDDFEFSSLGAGDKFDGEALLPVLRHGQSRH
jgi:hypothetical protein